MNVDPSYTGAIPLGAYAPPGEVVTTHYQMIDVDGLQIHVGELYDDLRNLDHIETWERAPNLRVDIPVQEGGRRWQTRTAVPFHS